MLRVHIHATACFVAFIIYWLSPKQPQLLLLLLCIYIFNYIISTQRFWLMPQNDSSAAPAGRSAICPSLLPPTAYHRNSISLIKCDSCPTLSCSLIVPSRRLPLFSNYASNYTQNIWFAFWFRFSFRIKAKINQIAHAHYKTLFYYYQFRHKQTSGISIKSKTKPKGKKLTKKGNKETKLEGKHTHTQQIAWRSGSIWLDPLFGKALFIHCDLLRLQLSSQVQSSTSSSRSNSLFTASLIMVHMFRLVIVVIISVVPVVIRIWFMLIMTCLMIWNIFICCFAKRLVLISSDWVEWPAITCTS